MDRADMRRAQWEEWWCRFPENAILVARRLEKLKLEPSGEERFAPLDLHAFDDALYTFKDRTGQGLDCTGPRFYKNLPRKAREGFAELLADCERRGMWPRQMLLQAVAFIPKSAGGERPIA
jgi:hypothetical protein